MNRILRVNQQQIARLERDIILPGQKIGMRGRYKLDAVRPDGRIRPLTGWFDNLITDYGLNYAGANGSYFYYCSVGSGNTAPANSDTTLVAQVAAGATYIATNGSAQPSTPYYGTRTMVYQFGQGVAAGNLAEVGVGPNNAGGNLWSRALILDAGGSPTTITVLSDEFLNVTYQLELYPSLVDTTGTVVIGGVTYNFTGRSAYCGGGNWIPYTFGGDAAYINNCSVFDGLIGSLTGSPAGTQSGPNSFTRPAYSAGSLTSVGTGTWSLGQANFTLPGGVKSLLFYGGGNNAFGAYQIQFLDGSSNGIPKDASSVMTLTMQYQWGRGTS